MYSTQSQPSELLQQYLVHVGFHETQHWRHDATNAAVNAIRQAFIDAFPRPLELRSASGLHVENFRTTAYPRTQTDVAHDISHSLLQSDPILTKPYRRWCDLL